jgi:hypothetical protein
MRRPRSTAGPAWAGRGPHLGAQVVGAKLVGGRADILRLVPVDHGIVKLLEAAYLRMCEVGPGFSLGTDYTDETHAYVLIGIEKLIALDDANVYETLSALSPGAMRFVASQSIIELRRSGYEVEYADEDDEE